MKRERVAENLNRGLHRLFEETADTFLIGEDLLDPYGGAFKISRGLSTKFPDRVIASPISEAGMVGFAAGLALMGNRPIVEIMFGDFVTLAYDQIVNFATKSVTMYGDACELPCVVRVPVGGGRGYGPTHSQSLQKHFVGIPNLSLYELSPFHDNVDLLRRLTRLPHPSILFEDKTLYTRETFVDGSVDELFSFEVGEAGAGYARVFCPEVPKPRCSIVATGGVALRALAAARELLLELEIECEVIVPSRLYPLDIPALAALVSGSELVFTAEEGGAGGAWGNEVAVALSQATRGTKANPVTVITSKRSIIPAAVHLEREVLVQKETIVQAVMGRVGC